MQRARLSWMIAGLGLITICGQTTFAGPPACDDRVALNNTLNFPWNTISTVRYDPEHDGTLGPAVGSGVLVGPHCVLTAGHVVYNRDEGHFNYSDIHIQPAAYLDGNDVVYPYGFRIALHKRTNDKYADTSYTPKSEVDYGALQFVCPFEDLTTYIPVVFEYDPSFINMAGYPVEELPDPSRSLDMWRVAGDIDTLEDRRLYYDARSTGGASGAPVWTFNADTDTRRLIALNNAHSTECNGIGARLVSQNEALILSWMEWEPTFDEKLAAGCAFSGTVVGWSSLLGYYAQNPWLLTAIQSLQIIDPPFPPPIGPPTRKVFQYIEGTFYAWEEYAVEPTDPDGLHFLHMTRPENLWLSVDEAQVLLTASSKWVDSVPAGASEVIVPFAPVVPVPQPIDLAPAGIPDARVDLQIAFAPALERRFLAVNTVCDCLYTVDTLGNTTPIGPLTGAPAGGVFPNVTNLARDLNGTLYAVDNFSGRLLSIDATTGAATDIGGMNLTAGGLAIAPVPVPGPGGMFFPAGTLFAADAQLRVIDKSNGNVVIVLGGIGTDVAGLAFRSDGELFAIELNVAGADHLLHVSTQNGSAMPVGVVGPAFDVAGALEFDANDTLWASDIGVADQLVRLDVFTAQVLESIPLDLGHGPQGLAFAGLLPVASGFRRGDTNVDGAVGIADPISTLGYLFSGAATPTCLDAADVDDDGQVLINDPVLLLAYLFSAGAPPVAPGPTNCGADLAADSLAACVYAACP
ncbi:MAG: hypothetical protein ACKVX7_06430 [Planctomycetota bacterium]